MKFEPFLKGISKTGSLELRRAVDLDDVAVGIEQEELGETGGTVAADHDGWQQGFWSKIP